MTNTFKSVSLMFVNRYITIIALTVFPLCLYSQVDSTATPKETILPRINKTKVDSSHIASYVNPICQDSIRKKDSIITTLKNENKELRAKVERADSLIIRIMNNRLMSRFHKENVDEAIADYNNISNKQLKEEYRYRETLLKSYERYYLEIKPFLETIQNDYYRYDVGFYIKQYKEECTKLLKGLSYYKFYASGDEKVKIPYLDHIITLIEKELNKHGTKDKDGKVHISDFSMIINELSN